MKTLTLKAERMDIGILREESGIRAAVDDLCRDIKKVLGRRPPIKTGRGVITVTMDGKLEAETHRIRTTGEGVEIAGGDETGTIHGIYEFAHRHLGVDPLWYWKGVEPGRREAVEIAEGEERSEKPVFRHRGWFLNDEDLLSHWKPESGRRFTEWPGREETLKKEFTWDNYERRLLEYYTPVTPPEVMEMVYEALLRLGGNLVIPASFVDVMNPAEAELVRAAARRGLRVSQHHVEPMGVSHFAYETWAAKQGERAEFSYRQAPETMRRAWRAYAEKWQEVAGGKIIWQMGLRGRGDRALWDHDPEAKAKAGEFITRALWDQWEILRELEPNPQATLTLWAEGAELIAQRAVKPPEGVTLVFADSGRTQEMQEDFHKFPRGGKRTFGIYYHPAVWPMGPHLVQGQRPEKTARVLRSAAEKGDTEYGILNVCNIREHVAGIAAGMQVLRNPAGWEGEEVFLNAWSPALKPQYAKLWESMVELGGEQILHDGWAYSACRRMREQLEKNESQSHEVLPTKEISIEELKARLRAASEKLDGLAAEGYPAGLSARERMLHDMQITAQAAILGGLYKCLTALMESPNNPPALQEACAALDEAMALRKCAEQGEWKGWYRGDIKENLPQLREQIAALGEGRLREFQE